MVRRTAFISIALFFHFLPAAWCQQGLVNTISLIDAQRVEQLLDTTPSNTSFCFRTSGLQSGYFSATYQYNSRLPAGYNNGSLYPAAGFQQQYSAGLTAQWGRLQLQLQPELVMAVNTQPDGLPSGFNQKNYWSRYYEKVLNVIDRPDHFGAGSLTKLFPGQSSLRYNTKGFSIGISTENLWWGPGVYHSLVLTNNAPGFLHLTLNTRKPWVTGIGSFEGQLIAGQLLNSNETPPENLNPNAAPYYLPKRDDNRYITGITLTWQPKWTKNLYVGFANMAYMYNHDMQGLKHVLPFRNFWVPVGRPALGSLFLRYAMPADHAELYVEYGRADRPALPYNIFGDSTPTGYIAGVRKLVVLNRNRGAIVIHLELSHLQMPDTRLLFVQSNPALPSLTSSWYTDAYVRQGYTNQGKLLGDGIGPGSGSQLMDVSWVKGLNRLGLQFERIIHNSDFYYYNYFNGLVYPGPNNKYWTDILLSLHGRWARKKWLLAGEIQHLHAINYKWVKIGPERLWDPSPRSDKNNLQLILSLRYQL